MKDNEKPINSISSAVALLSELAELDMENEMPLNQEENLAVHLEEEKIFPNKTIQIIKNNSEEESVNIINSTFRVVLDYLVAYYQKNEKESGNIDNITNIMLLVGEAAKKFDKYMRLNHKMQKKIVEFKPYRDLQSFYQSKIKQLDEATLGKWLLGLSRNIIERKKQDGLGLSDNHSVIDFEEVKRDLDYELFFVRKENGDHFFNARVVRNMKLINNFGSRHSRLFNMDLIMDMALIDDQTFRTLAEHMIYRQSENLDVFYHHALKHKSRVIVTLLNKSLMALMLAGNEYFSLKDSSVKSCRDYFIDFQGYLREAVESSDYQKLMAYQDEQSLIDEAIINMIQGLCNDLYLSVFRFQGFSTLIQRILVYAKEFHHPKEDLKEKYHSPMLERLVEGHSALTAYLPHHLEGPLAKVLKALEEDKIQSFDPFNDFNLPNFLYQILLDGHFIQNIHLPAPIHQEYIHKSFVNNEFKSFLQFCLPNKKKHLIINLQGRSGWKEQARSLALENLASLTEFKDAISLATLPKDTDFYEQTSPFNEDNRAEVFLEQLKRHMESAFYFSSEVKEAVSEDWISDALKAIHKTFFSSKNMILTAHRLDFIEICYLFLILKIIDIEKPNSFSLICKDGVDVSASENALLYIFLKMLSLEPLGHEDWLQIETMLYAPALLVRERTIHKKCFNRMIHALKTIDLVYREWGPLLFGQEIRKAFGDLYSSSILDGRITNSKNALNF